MGLIRTRCRARLQKGPVTSGTSGGHERDKRGNKKRSRGKLHFLKKCISSTGPLADRSLVVAVVVVVAAVAVVVVVVIMKLVHKCVCVHLLNFHGNISGKSGAKLARA